MFRKTIVKATSLSNTRGFSSTALKLPSLYPVSVLSKKMVLENEQFTQQADSEECGFVAGRQIVNFNSDMGYVGSEHGQYWALQSKRFHSFDAAAIRERKFQLAPSDTDEMIRWLTRTYGMASLISFPLKGKSINETLRVQRSLKKDGLPGFQILGTSGGHVYAIHEMDRDGRFLTTGVPKGPGIYSPTKLVTEGILCGSESLTFPGCKPFSIRVEPEYGYISKMEIDRALKKGPFSEQFEQLLRWLV